MKFLLIASTLCGLAGAARAETVLSQGFEPIFLGNIMALRDLCHDDLHPLVGALANVADGVDYAAALDQQQAMAFQHGGEIATDAVERLGCAAAQERISATLRLRNRPR